MAVTPNAAPTGYNSAYTGPQIDAAVGAVIDKETAWDEAAAGKLPAGGEAGQVLEKTGAEDNAAEWRTPPFLVRPNLLDNWYFVGGGSQLGDGVFPINQRGQTSYGNANQMCVDRWKLGVNTVTINADSISLPGNMWQNIPSSSLLGKIVTFTALLKDNTLRTMTVSIPNVDPSAWSVIAEQSGLRIAFESAGRLRLQIFNADFVAVKLELGDTQTLAHQEGDDWVLNELPDFGEELKKCERHYFRKAFSRLPALFIGGSFDYIDVNIPIYDLAAVVTVSNTTLIVAPNVAYVNGEQKTISSCTVNSIMRDGTDGQLCVRFKTNHLTDSAYAMGALDAFRIAIEV